MPVPLSLPIFHSDTETIVIEQILIHTGQRVDPGMEMLICRIEFGGVASHDCPLQMSYSVLAGESCLVRDICVEAGSEIAPGQPIAMIERYGPSTGAVRIMTAAVIRNEFW